VITSTSADFWSTDAHATVVFVCLLARSAFGACASARSNATPADDRWRLSPGDRTISVAATDAAGHIVRGDFRARTLAGATS
jgi:hypothetical protein